MSTDSNDDQSGTELNVSLDTAILLHNALGLSGTVSPSPNSSTVALTLDADTADKLKSALKTGLHGAAAIAFGADTDPE